MNYLTESLSRIEKTRHDQVTGQIEKTHRQGVFHE